LVPTSQAVYATVINATTYSTASRLFRDTQGSNQLQRFPSSAALYPEQDRQKAAVERVVSADVAARRAAIREPIIIAIDCSWNHRKKASAGIVTAQDTSTNKIIAYDLRLRKSGADKGNWGQSPQGMEKAGAEAIAVQIAPQIRAGMITGFVHDNHRGTGNVLRAAKLREFRDINHEIKRLKKLFSCQPKLALPGTGRDGRRKRVGVLDDIQDGLMGHLYYCLEQLDWPPRDRMALMATAVEHYTGPDSRWLFREEATARLPLVRVVLALTEVAARCRADLVSQGVESFYGRKADYLPKDLAFSKSRSLRLLAAIGVWNDPEGFREAYAREARVEPAPAPRAHPRVDESHYRKVNAQWAARRIGHARKVPGDALDALYDEVNTPQKKRGVPAKEWEAFDADDVPEGSDTDSASRADSAGLEFR
jgi:hypothetical protein